MKKLFHYSIPHLVHIETTYACNSCCVFCYNPYRKNKINYSKIEKIVKTVACSHIPHVYLIGGEPSLLKTERLNKYINLLAKNSSVTIVTNGLIYKNGLSKNLACIGVPIHGDKKTHDMLTRVNGGYERVIKTIKNYVKDGFDVRCIPVLMSVNYDQMYGIIKSAKELGMESVFVDRFESGGIGLEAASKLKPTLSQFQEALTQMIKAKNDFKIPVGFGTAIPFCLDERLITEDMWANCGVGVSFGAINPDGDFRICNQSDIVYGNILEESIKKIWNKKKIDEFRRLKWVGQPCKNCPFLKDCTCGCKVDINYCKKYCIDYAVRENKGNLTSIKKLKELKKIFDKHEQEKFSRELPKEYRYFKLNKYTKLNCHYEENYLVTRYQTISLNSLGVKLLKEIIKGVNSEKKLIEKFENLISVKEIRKFISILLKVEAISLMENEK